LWPVNKPVAKIEGQSQCTGEAEYVADISPSKGELHAAFVISNIANCDLDVVDTSEALVCFYFLLLIFLFKLSFRLKNIWLQLMEVLKNRR
jgi:CO/xanthine dehydrogenase Mo-binding subunit